MTLAPRLGKGGSSGVREGGERGQGRGSFLKERKSGSLGTEKARFPPPYSWLPAPPPPPANTWHGHKQGLRSLPLGQAWIKEVKNRKQAVRWRGLPRLPLWPMGKRALASCVGSWLFPPPPTSPSPQTPHQAMLPQGQRKLAQHISQGAWGAGLLGLRVAKLSEVFFLTPSCPDLLSLLHPTPSPIFPQILFP